MPSVERSLDLCASSSHGRLSDPIQLVTESGEMRGWWRSEEVGHVPGVREEGEKQPEIVIAMELLDDLTSLSEPQEVGCVSHGAGDRARRPDDLAERRDAEAAVEHGID